MNFFIILSIQTLLGASLLFSSTDNKSNNFTLESECFIDIQKQRDKYKKDYYNSLVFEKNISTAKIVAKKEMLKKINLQIQSTATLYYKTESIRKNNKLLSNITQQEFQQKISTDTLDLEINKLTKKEFYCKAADELFFLSLIKRKDVITQVKNKLKNLSEKNKIKFSIIKSTKNILNKALLFEEIKADYLPYLMILESEKVDKSLREKYFKEIVKYENSYHNFLQNTQFYIDIKYPYSRVYPVEERIDEVRQEVIRYLAQHSIYATNLMNIKTVNTIAKKTKKDIALITVILREHEATVPDPDPDSYSGTMSIEYYRLEIKLENTIKPKKKSLQKMKSIYIKYPNFLPPYKLTFKKSVQYYHRDHDLIKSLSQ